MERDLINVSYSSPFDGRDKNKAVYTYCKNAAQCPLLKESKCIQTGFMQKCVYGSTSKKEGWTKRSRKFREFEINTKKHDLFNRVKCSTKKKIAYVGEYVWLPYSHMNHVDWKNHEGECQLGWEGHSGVFSNGAPFLKRSLFTVENISKIISFCPSAMIGGRITSYQAESVPEFLFDLSEYDKELFDKLAEFRPDVLAIVDKQKPKFIKAKDIMSMADRSSNLINVLLENGLKAKVYSTDNVHVMVPVSKMSGIIPGAKSEKYKEGFVEVQCSLEADEKLKLDPSDTYKYSQYHNIALKRGYYDQAA